jgi:hypothetical protein
VDNIYKPSYEKDCPVYYLDDPKYAHIVRRSYYMALLFAKLDRPRWTDKDRLKRDQKRDNQRTLNSYRIHTKPKE